MAYETLKAGRASLNVTLAVAQRVQAEIIAAGIGKGKPVALFVIPQGGNLGSMSIPITKTQDNGTAQWVATDTDLESLNVPATEELFFNVWVESHRGTYMVGGLVRAEKYETITEALSD